MRLLVRLFLLVLGLTIAVPFGAATLAAGLPVESNDATEPAAATRR